MKKFFILTLIMIFFGFIGCEKPEEKTKGAARPKKVARANFSKDVDNILNKKIDLLKKFIAEPIIVKSVTESNKKNANMSLEKIKEIDNKWIKTKGIDDFIKSFITNKCALELIKFQEEKECFPEIFVTDEKGLVVCETNKTSDYYQADESWWVESYNNGIGAIKKGGIEYDESAKSEVIAIYLPVMDKKTNKAIGVVKALIDITSIKMEL